MNEHTFDINILNVCFFLHLMNVMNFVFKLGDDEI